MDVLIFYNTFMKSDSSSGEVSLFKKLTFLLVMLLFLIRVDLQVNHSDAEVELKENFLQKEEGNHNCYMMLNKY